MMKFELHVIQEDGKLEPTGIWKSGTSLSSVEPLFDRVIKKIGKPCIIAVSELKRQDIEQRKADLERISKKDK